MGGPPVTDLQGFLEERPRLLGLSYRMLGSASQAEDVLQEAYLRWQAAPEVRQPRAFLTRVVTNLCLDQLKSARHTREHYVGSWLPEPVAPDDPEATTLQQESLRFAFLRLLEALDPRQRAAYLLREVLEHEYAELAEFLEETESNCRQLVSRAKKQLEARRGRYQPAPQEVEELLESFAQAARGEPEALLQRLHRDVTVWSDGGGKVAAALNPVQGREKVARMMAGLIRKGGATARVVPTSLNDEPALLVYQGEKLDTVVILQLGPEGLEAIYLQRNPEKLAGLRRPSWRPDPH